jgi:hypothetical protein
MHIALAPKSWRRKIPDRWRAITRLPGSLELRRRAQASWELTALQLGRPEHRMTRRDDLLFWLAIICFSGLCGAAVWVTFFS